MNPLQGVQEVVHGGPHTFGGVNVHCADAIPNVVPCQLLLAVANGDVYPDDMLGRVGRVIIHKYDQ